MADDKTTIESIADTAETTTTSNSTKTKSNSSTKSSSTKTNSNKTASSTKTKSGSSKSTTQKSKKTTTKSNSSTKQSTNANKNSESTQNNLTKEKKEKPKHFYSNKELEAKGIHSKLTPVRHRAIEKLNSESRKLLSMTTKAHVPVAMIKILLGLAIATGLIIFCVMRYKLADNLNMHIAYILGIIVTAISASFILLKSSQILNGYCTIRDGWHDWIDVVATLFNVIGMIVVMPASMFATLFQGKSRVKYIEMIRLAVPYGMGADDVIENGEDWDRWASLSETIKRIEEGDDYNFYD